MIFVFGYGSLVSAASAARTLGAAPDPVPATLAGWRPAWNVGSDTGSHPDREFRDRHGRVYDGVVAVLGIEPGAGCPGAVFTVGAHVLPALDRRERNYDRRDVTGRVGWPGKPDGCRVYTYVPRADARRRLVEAEEVVVRSSYLALLRAVPAPPFPVRDLSQHVRLTRGG